MIDRAALESAFIMAEGAQEVAFRAHQRAVKANRHVLIASWVAQGKRAHKSLVQAALDLSTIGKETK